MKIRTREHAPYEITYFKKDKSFKYMFWINFLISTCVLILSYNTIIWLISVFIGLIISIFGFRNIIWYINNRLFNTELKYKQTTAPKISQNLSNHHNYFRSNKRQNKYYLSKYLRNIRQSFKYLFYIFIGLIFVSFVLQSHKDDAANLIVKLIHWVPYFILILPPALAIIFLIDSSKKNNVFYYLSLKPQYFYKVGNKIFFY